MACFYALDTCKENPTDAAHRKDRLTEIHMSSINIFLSTLTDQTHVINSTFSIIENSKDSFVQMHHPRKQHLKLFKQMCYLPNGTKLASRVISSYNVTVECEVEAELTGFLYAYFM